MPLQRKISKKRLLTKAKYVRIFCFLISGLLIIGTLVSSRITFSADTIIHSNKSAVAFIKPGATPETKNTSPPLNVPPPTTATRIKLMIGETRDVSVMDAVNSVMVVSPEIVTAQIKNGSVLTITGLKIGETILIISGDGKRQTLIAEVAWKPPVSKSQNLTAADNSARKNVKTSGTYNLVYAQDTGQTPGIAKNQLEVRRKLSKDQTLRVSTEMYKFFGGEPNSLGHLRNYGLNRISVGVDSPGKTIDFLDSQVRISPVVSDSFEMRGFSLTSTPELSKDSKTPRKGLQIFAGLVRTNYSLDNKDRAKIVGAMIPVVSSDSLQIRAGFTAVDAPQNDRFGRGGLLLNLDGSYASSEKFSANWEMSLTNGALSWGANLNVKLKKLGASGAVSRTAKNSPLGGIGAFSGGRQTEAFSFYWRPDKHFNFSVNYNHTDVRRFTNSGFANFNRTTFSANANYRPNKNSRLNLRFLDQQIEAAVPGSTSKFLIATRTFSAAYNLRFNKYLSNDFEARINFSREANAGAEMETGFNVREQLRFSRNGNSLTGFFNYTNRTPSLLSLIVRNPQLLPPALQAEFALNPALFLQIHRDRLAYLLPGIEIPMTRSLDTGVRYQTTISRFTLTGETRYGAGEIYSQNQKNLSVSIGANLRIDAANSVQINARHNFGATGGGSALIFGFTHRFGADSGGSFQFPNFLGLNKGKVRGRVYYDLNGNGRDDEGEPGIAGLTVQLDEKRSVKTGLDGKYEFSANEGRYNIRIVSEKLGVSLQSTTGTQQQILLSSREALKVSFGVSDFGFVAGRVFNDLGLTNDLSGANVRGVEGVRVILHSLDAKSEKFVESRMSGSGGSYEFRNLRPGKYLLEIDLATLPANFRLPAQNSWEIKVLPLQGFYLDIPITAQRAITGVVFIDKDGDGKFNPQKDEPVEGATVTVNDSVAVSDRNGAYILRNLPAGRIKAVVRTPKGSVNSPIFIDLSVEPMTKRGVNFVVTIK